MLEKVNQNPNTGPSVFNVSNIPRDAQFTTIAYVRGGQHKFTRADKPFITLYLQDEHGVVIPGYIFDLRDFMGSGLELTKVIHSFVQVTAMENYLPKFGMSVIIDKLSLITNPSSDIATRLLGTVGDTTAVYNTLMKGIEKKLGIKITLPYNICTASYMDYYQGRVGGLCRHYLNMFDTLSVWSGEMSNEESRLLFSTYVLYVFAHNNYMAAREDGNDDIRLVNTLTASISKYMEALKVGDGAIEVIHLFFGYEPKDLFVRMVHQASLANTRAMNELATFRSLPISREGDAGYGTIKRYATTQ